MNELSFEQVLIEKLAGIETPAGELREGIKDHLKNHWFWKYEPDIKTTEDLWDNFKQILEQHNKATVDRPLSVTEFNQVKQIISDLKTPYQAGQFLYGLNGRSQIEIDLDDGKHVYLDVFDQKKVGAGDTVYQVVNQIQRPAVINGKQDRRFDTTLLINGLPIIQIEEKTDTHDVNEALNQMHQYILENQYSNIYSTVQILVALTPNNVKYMANTTAEKFNKDFAFNWQREDDNSIVRDWREFADKFLSIPMAHQMATNYMILDGTKNKQSLKVMRPYQVYATRKVIQKIKHTDFSLGKNLIGYIWHTTGSGKTITSFKTAWLASRLPNVDKVVFVVDRVALTKQTFQNYHAYDPDADEEKLGSVQDTRRTSELARRLRSKDNNIIVTTSQKLDTLVKRDNFKAPEKNIVFIVDEAHRSTGGASFEKIQKAFTRAAWVGYTGTPMFDETTKGLRTEDIFGPLLHAYTIREAIADHNVLGFKVDFETTISEDTIKDDFLPKHYRRIHPNWDDQKIKHKIENLSYDDIDDQLEPTFYDNNREHIKLVVEDIFKKWRNRSNDGKYNALLTTHVGGLHASTPMAMAYFREFQRVNEEHRKNGGLVLKVAVTFSQNNSNNDTMVETNDGLSKAMDVYNQQFGTNFGLDDVSGYAQDVISRLNKTAEDGNFLDLVIVVDQLLTGFDAPELNTLYVDRTLRGAGLIQAYSRTNRIADLQEKPWGRIVNYRWPTENEKLMNEALAIYANRNSADLSDEERKRQNNKENITAPEFKDLLKEVKNVVITLSSMTKQFTELPKSEREQERMFDLLVKYNHGIAKLKQYEPGDDDEDIGYDYDDPDALIKKLGMTPEQEVQLTTVLTNELKHILAEKKHIEPYQLELKMTHIKDVRVNYDYLTELVELLLNQVHEGKKEAAEETRSKIDNFAKGLEDRKYAQQIVNAANAISRGDFPPADSKMKYPYKLDSSDEVIQEANHYSLNRVLLNFRNKWGITDIITSDKMHAMFARHKYGKQDLDDTGEVRKLLAQASSTYKEMAYDADVQKMSKIKYRNGLREAFYELADEMIKVI